MDLNLQHLEALRLVCQALEKRQKGWDAALEGHLNLSPDLYHVLDLLIKDEIIEREIKVGHEYPDWNHFSPESEDTIELTLPVTEWGQGENVVYRNLDALISRGLFLQSTPKTLYLIEENLILPPDKPTDRVQIYLDAVAVAKLLTQQADHTDQTGGIPRLIFLHKVSLTIPIHYAIDDLSAPIDGLQELQLLIRSEEHKEQKRSLFKAALYARLSNTKESDRFAYLLEHFQDFSQEFRENYQLFVCEFDFDEVREELEEKKRDYLARLNAAFNDMGAKLLSIPLAFYVAVTKVGPISSGNTPFETVLINTLVTMAVVTVGVYILMLLQSHRHTLEATVDEYNNLFTRWLSKLKYTEQQQHVTQTRSMLDRRKRRVLLYFRITKISVFGILAITLALFAVRLFRWEVSIWDAMQAFKSLIIP